MATLIEQLQYEKIFKNREPCMLSKQKVCNFDKACQNFSSKARNFKVKIVGFVDDLSNHLNYLK